MQQRDGKYNPAVRHEVTVSEVAYRGDGGTAWLARMYRPNGEGPFPVLLDVHGGAWNLGDRSRDEFLNTAMAASGLLVVAVDFRLAPQHPYPAQVSDVNYATRWLKAHAREFGGDANRLGGLGTSSGGHTVLVSAMRPDDPRYGTLRLPDASNQDARLAYVVLNSAVIDPHARYLYAKRAGLQRLVSMTETYFLDEDTMREGNPQGILDRGEPAEHPPILIIHGTADNNVPNEIPERFAASYRATGGKVQLEEFPNMPHVFASKPGPQAEQAHRTIKTFIAQQLGAATVSQGRS